MIQILKEIKPHVSLQLAMNIANTEACLSGSPNVEPFHILLAILNIVDDNYAQAAEAIDLNPAEMKMIEETAGQCRALLKISDKEITVVRRALHKILRQREPGPWQALECSTESTYLLHKAARKGYHEGFEELNLGYVLAELLADLPEEVAPYFRTA
jgi:hypothetical protein